MSLLDKSMGQLRTHFEGVAGKRSGKHGYEFRIGSILTSITQVNAFREMWNEYYHHHAEKVRDCFTTLISVNAYSRSRHFSPAELAHNLTQSNSVKLYTYKHLTNDFLLTLGEGTNQFGIVILDLPPDFSGCSYYANFLPDIIEEEKKPIMIKKKQYNFDYALDAETEPKGPIVFYSQEEVDAMLDAERKNLDRVVNLACQNMAREWMLPEVTYSEEYTPYSILQISTQEAAHKLHHMMFENHKLKEDLLEARELAVSMNKLINDGFKKFDFDSTSLIGSIARDKEFFAKYGPPKDELADICAKSITGVVCDSVNNLTIKEMQKVNLGGESTVVVNGVAHTITNSYAIGRDNDSHCLITRDDIDPGIVTYVNNRGDVLHLPPRVDPNELAYVRGGIRGIIGGGDSSNG